MFYNLNWRSSLSPVHQNITYVRVSLVDVNDNRPEFSSSSYVSSVLLRDAEEGKLLLTLTAADRDVGNNSLITYRSVQPTVKSLTLPPYSSNSRHFKDIRALNPGEFLPFSSGFCLNSCLRELIIYQFMSLLPQSLYQDVDQRLSPVSDFN